MKTKEFIFSFLFLFFVMKNVSAQPGALDPSFGVGGIVNLHPNFTVDQARDIALTTDGKILLLSSDYQIKSYLIRLNSDGTLDLSFGDQGKLAILQGFSEVSTAIEVDTLNRILVYAKNDDYWSPSFAVYRFLKNGAKDSSFGYNGKRVTLMLNANRAMIIQADNKIVVGGQNNNLVATVERYNVDGSNDNGFHGVGSNALTTLPNSYVFAMHQQPDGKLLATGTADGKMFVARFNTNGNLDPTFNNIGYATVSGNDILAGQAVQTMPDGKILVAGHSENADSSSMLCWRFLANGALDNSFGNNGVDTLYSGGENNFAWFIFLNADSTATVGGSIFNGLVYQPVLYHLLNDGSVDNSFGVNGIAGKTFDCGSSIQINSVRTTDGKILFCGTAFENGNNLVGVSRFSPDGLIDSSFANIGTASFVSVDSIADYDIIQDFTVLPDGKIFCASVNNEGQLIYTRIDSNGTLDSTYGVNGYYVPNQRVGQSNGEVAIMTSNNLNIYVAQNCYKELLGDEDLTNIKGPFGVVLHKFNVDGNPDTSFGAGGILQLHFTDEGDDEIDCSDLKLIPDGKLLLATRQSHDLGFPYGTYTYIFLEQLNGDGSTDTAFAYDGTQTFDWIMGKASQLLINVQGDGKVNCLYGDFLYPNGYTDISRLLPNGLLDSTFAYYGTEALLLEGGYQQWLLQSDNKMLTLLFFPYGPYLFAMLRFNEDGTIDSTFGNNGYLDLSLLNYGPNVGCTLQSDDKVLATNATFDGKTTVARYLNDGAVDLGFGTNGLATFTPQGSFPHLLRMQTDGKILTTQNYNGDFFIARLLGGIGTSVVEPENVLSMYVYPNPASDKLIIVDSFSSNDEVSISINDMSGKMIKEQIGKFMGNHLILSVEDLSAGIYLLTFRTANASQIIKFVKQ